MVIIFVVIEAYIFLYRWCTFIFHQHVVRLSLTNSPRVWDSLHFSLYFFCFCFVLGVYAANAVFVQCWSLSISVLVGNVLQCVVSLSLSLSVFFFNPWHGYGCFNVFILFYRAYILNRHYTAFFAIHSHPSWAHQSSSGLMLRFFSLLFALLLFLMRPTQTLLYLCWSHRYIIIVCPNRLCRLERFDEQFRNLLIDRAL